MAIQIAVRPGSISGELQTFTESFTANVVRSSVESMDIKTRRRTTAVIRTGDATMTLPVEVYGDFRAWFETACWGGALPTRFVLPPDCKEEVWRFAAPPAIAWLNQALAFRVTFKIEQMPVWRSL